MCHLCGRLCVWALGAARRVRRPAAGHSKQRMPRPGLGSVVMAEIGLQVGSVTLPSRLTRRTPLSGVRPGAAPRRTPAGALSLVGREIGRSGRKPEAKQGRFGVCKGQHLHPYVYGVCERQVLYIAEMKPFRKAPAEARDAMQTEEKAFPGAAPRQSQHGHLC